VARKPEELKDVKRKENIRPSEKELIAMAKEAQAIVDNQNKKILAARKKLDRLLILAKLAQATVEERNRNTLLTRKAKKFFLKK
jgi:hypothetical protein